MDFDQSAKRIAQKYLEIVHPDYYDFEAHMHIDDAFELNDLNEPVINKYVEQFIGCVEVAAQ